MPPTGKSAQKLRIRVAPTSSSAIVTRRIEGRINKRDRESARATQAIARQIRALTADYQKQLSKLLGPRAMRELNAIRGSRAKLTRAQKIRRSLAVLKELDVDRDRIRDLRRPSLLESRDLLSQATEVFPYEDPLEGPCQSPWVTYTAPFGGYAWSYHWNRSSNPENPFLERYLDLNTGRIGSRIETKLSGADDDDELTAEYYTAFNVWHTPQQTGPLEVYLAFEFNSSTYSGKVTDEFGFSGMTYGQYALARMSATDSQDANQKDDQGSKIYGFADFLWGEGRTWSEQAASPRDIHSFYFKTAATFFQGSPVLLEGGVNQGAWFIANDESISTFADLDMRLVDIRVRSCKPDIFL